MPRKLGEKPPLKVYYDSTYVVKSTRETVTKSLLVAKLIEAGKAGKVLLEAPKPATRKELSVIHGKDYLKTVFEDKKGFLEVGPWSEPLLASILASTGGMRDAVAEALLTGRSGSLSSGLHHARKDSGQGFCTLNGLALAAQVALKKVKIVGLLDLDAHFGGGTFDILKAQPRVRLADVSVNSYDAWEPTDPKRHLATLVTNPERYLEETDKALAFLEGIDFLIYNAGMDTYEKAGGLKGITRAIIKARESRVVAWAKARRIPMIFALAGGYKWGGLSLEQIAELHLETIKAVAQD